MNIAYKHLDSKLRIMELSIWQWVGVIVGVGAAALWGLYLSPFGTSLSLITSVYIGAVPAGAALMASVSEFDLWLLLRSAMRWRRLDGRFVSGPGSSARGYVLHEEQDQRRAVGARPPLQALDLASLWETS